jgi:hypothetical protein
MKTALFDQEETSVDMSLPYVTRVLEENLAMRLSHRRFRSSDVRDAERLDFVGEELAHESRSRLRESPSACQKNT